MKPFLTITFIIFFFIIVLPALAERQNVDEVNDLLKKEKIELDKLKVKINKQTKALARMGEKKYSILKKQRHLDDKLKMREKELKIYDWNLKINKNTINDLIKNIKVSKKELYSQRIAMSRRLRMIYKEGSMFPIKMIFLSIDFTDLLKRLKYMESIAVHDSKLFNHY